MKVVYEGTFYNDRMEGFGTLYEPYDQLTRPIRTEGEFFNNKPFGKGTVYRCDGLIFNVTHDIDGKRVSSSDISLMPESAYYNMEAEREKALRIAQRSPPLL